MKQYVISGIGTGVGKTVVSAIVSEALKATYWKPIQAGDIDNSDSIKVARLSKNAKVLPEAFQLTEPMSPHAAAEIDGVDIQLVNLKLPKVTSNLVVEGAGGILVPINKSGLTYTDVFEAWKIPVILVSRHYLGSINHSLLTAEVLLKRGVEIEGWIFIGEEDMATEEIIIQNSGVKMIARISEVEEVTPEFIEEQAEKIAQLL